jgi:hypothetical protein
MTRIRFTRWWQYGLFAGVVLSLATLVKVIHAEQSAAPTRGRQTGWGCYSVPDPGIRHGFRI